MRHCIRLSIRVPSLHGMTQFADIPCPKCQFARTSYSNSLLLFSFFLEDGLMIEILERGDHTLEVGVTYTSNSSPHPRTFRKMYNFNTFDTITIRSQSRTLPSRTVLFQMHIENTGDSILHLKQVNFHTEPVWDAKSCNALSPVADKIHTGEETVSMSETRDAQKSDTAENPGSGDELG